MKHTPKSIRDYMARLGKRPKRMTPAAIAQRTAAARRPRRPRRSVLAQPEPLEKVIP